MHAAVERPKRRLLYRPPLAAVIIEGARAFVCFADAMVATLAAIAQLACGRIKDNKLETDDAIKKRLVRAIGRVETAADEIDFFADCRSFSIDDESRQPPKVAAIA